MVETDHIPVRFLAFQSPTAIKRNARQLAPRWPHPTRIPDLPLPTSDKRPTTFDNRLFVQGSAPLPLLLTSARMDAPILRLVNASLIANMQHFAMLVAFSQHTNQAREIKLLILAAQADAGHLHGKVFLIDG